jgi:DNA-binding MarR family transcriptional regulator
MSRTTSANRRRWYFRQWLKTLDAFVDAGMRDLSRSELAVYLTLLRDTRPDGTARAGLSDLATRGGMSVRQASRAVQSLIRRDLVTVVKPGVPGKATLYTVFPLDAFRKLNPVAAKWVEAGRE